MNKYQIIQKTEEYVKKELGDDATGHDWWHVYRVLNTAVTIAEKEGRGDVFIIKLGAMLHDIADWKFYDGNVRVGPQKAEVWLQSLNVEQSIIEKVKDIIKEISFKGAGVATPMSSFEGEVVQDADRLDALGAVGIARTFAYGGSRGTPMHDPSIKVREHTSFEEYKKKGGTAINHFYEKLLLLKDRMNTKTGREMAQKRHLYMEEFLQKFYNEWEGKE
jgi:uncharacterized protein